MTENESINTLYYLLGHEIAIDEGLIESENKLNSQEKEALQFMLKECRQYRAIGTVEEIRSMIRKSDFTQNPSKEELIAELKELSKMKMMLECFEAIGTIEEFNALKETTVTQSDINAFKAYIDDCMDDVAFGNTDWNRSLALALKCMELHKT